MHQFNFVTHFLLIILLFGVNNIIFAYGKEVINAEAVTPTSSRTFVIDYANDRFLMDGKPFQYVGGSFHYFRTVHQTWRKNLRTMRAAGLNVVSTYVEWSLHNPRDGEYNWRGMANLMEFIRLAAEEDLYVILRPGPYICAERDMGGFPYWLLTKYPEIQLRTDDINFKYEVRLWYAQLMSRMEPLLYGNGGPIIMVQVENEYGSFYACDNNYKIFIRDETERYVKGKALLFTNDGPSQLRCGKIDGVFATLDFGPYDDIPKAWAKLRQFEPLGPLVNSEYYPGWLTHWQEQMQRTETQPILTSLRTMLNAKASVNFYMFFGGTNFGFTAGANDGGPGLFNADVTSYDYDAPMDESGDPTSKYMAIRDVIAEYFPMPNISVPEREPKMKLDPIQLKPITVLLSTFARKFLSNDPIISRNPVTFEKLNQNSGFVLYETELPIFERDPSLLRIDKLHDRGYVYIDRNFQGILSRENKIDSLPLSAGLGDKLQILVENQGRINFRIPNDFKGIIGDVRINGFPLHNWTITGFPLDYYASINNLIYEFNRSNDDDRYKNISNRSYLKSGPTLFYSEFNINTNNIYDTYLDPTGWGKGIVFINGFNLGRYWPAIGPQITLYVPKDILNMGINHMTVLELQKAPENSTMQFTDIPNLDGFHSS